MKRTAKDRLIHELRLPPQSIEAEESLLCAILLDNNELSQIREILESEDFYRTSHRKIFAAMLELADHEEPIDLVTLAICLKTKNQLEEIGGASYLAVLVDAVPMAINARHYAKIIRENAIKRSLIEESSKLAQKAFSETTDLNTLLADVMEMSAMITEKAAEGSRAQKLEITADDLQGYFSSLLKTPHKSLDEAIGGLAVGELTIVAGKSGMGKTALTLQFLGHTAIDEAKPAIYCGAQMKLERVYARLLAQRCRVSFKKLLGRNVPIDKRGLILENHKIINKAPILTEIINDEISLPGLFTKVIGDQKRIQDETGQDLGLLIIENLQQLKWPGKKFKNEWEKANFMVKQIKPWVNKSGIRTMVSSQLNRDVDDREDKRPVPTDIFSKDAEELSDNILLVYRPNVYEKRKIKTKGRAENDAEIIIGKGGAPVILKFTFWGDYLLWEEIEIQ